MKLQILECITCSRAHWKTQSKGWTYVQVDKVHCICCGHMHARKYEPSFLKTLHAICLPHITKGLVCDFCNGAHLYCMKSGTPDNHDRPAVGMNYSLLGQRYACTDSKYEHHSACACLQPRLTIYKQHL